MADAVFTDKLRRTASIFHIEAHSAGWQGVAEASLAAGGEFKNRIKALGFFHRLQPTHAVFIRPLRGNGLDVQETYLLRLAVSDRRAAADRVKIIIAKLLDRKSTRACRSEERRVGKGCVSRVRSRW